MMRRSVEEYMVKSAPFLSIDEFNVTSASTPEEVHAYCLKKYGVTPHFIKAVLSQGLPDDLRMKIEWDYDPKYGEWSALMIYIRNKNDKLVAHDYRLIDLDDDVTWPGDIHVDASISGQGIGTLLLFNQMRLINHIGISKMLIRAGNTTGAAVWGRLGFDLEGDKALGYFNRKILGRRLEIMSMCLGKDFVHHAYEACEALERGSVWPLTDLDQDIVEFHKKDNTMAMLHMMREEHVDATIGKVPIQESVLGAEALARFESRDVITVGQVLLVGQQWSGVFDFKSQRQLDRLARNFSTPLEITREETFVQRIQSNSQRGFKLG